MVIVFIINNTRSIKKRNRKIEEKNISVHPTEKHSKKLTEKKIADMKKSFNLARDSSNKIVVIS
ncbi:MAG: hypothetical protein A3F72_10710 [Bacteroidetes bacterium RIFCSPLOWO2_12_FULL_35_15]|nr:MAG: hypothetical protein A3F72_10710 [Bacteroidetes bacterium RIFCSPLOWO2_12_FULL_35_15]